MVSSSDSLQREQARVYLLAVAMLLAFVLLGIKLWRVQVVKMGAYEDSLRRQSMRRVRLPAQRGRIFDRNGTCMADNRPRFCLAVFAEELRQPGDWDRTVDEVERVVRTLSGVLKLKPEVTREDMRNHVGLRRPMPFLAWRNLDEEAVARWAESTVRVPGADLYVEPVRVYPLESVGAHLIGYVGRAEETQEPAAPYHFYLPEMEGRCGIERAFNADLAGEAGGRLIRVDASGFKYDDVAERDPKSGRDIALTIDVGFQRLTEDVLRGERGAAVVLDPRNGDVLAMASAPSFDPNAFSPRISAAALERMRTDRDKPFVNRAISGVYPAGSIFKPVVAFAALMSGRIGPDTVFECPGYLSLGEARIRCWQESGHGPLSLRKAIEQSCNCYFCQAGLQCGYQRICHMAASLGLGRRTHIEIGPEASGLLPSADWKMDVYRDGWRRGDTCNLSIGQGALSVTPLQMAVVAAALANGGFVFRPRLVRESGPAGEVVNRLAWPREATALVRGGMLDVVHGASGSGRRALVDGVTIAGKTGTAEYGPRSRRKKCAWMIAFAPFEAPRYAVALVIEDSISGGRTAAPKVSTLMRGVFEMDGTLAAGGRGAG